MAVHPWRRATSQWSRLQHGATSIGISPEAYAEHLQDNEAWCGWHKAWEPQSGFYANKANKLTGLAGRCREGDRLYNQQRAAAQKAQVS